MAASAVTVLDGGTGKELERIGAPFRQPEWSALALLEDPAAVTTVHDNFLAAGADVVTTNAYAVVPYHLGWEQRREASVTMPGYSGSVAVQWAKPAR